MNRSSIKDDSAKWAIVLPRVLLNFLKLWPENQNTITKVYSRTVIALLAVFVYTHTMFFIMNLRDITVMANAMATVAGVSQSLSKALILLVHSKKLKEMIRTITQEFWPANTVDRESERDFLFVSRLSVITMSIIYSTATLHGLVFLSGPWRTRARVLPFQSWYPFEWQKSPFYEIAYVTQCILDLGVVIVVVCGHDSLFLTICTNCIAQFKMLKQVISTIGTEKGIHFNKYFKNLKGSRIQTNVEENNLSERDLLIQCVEHQIKLFRLCNDIQEVFSLSTFVQLFCSVTAICGSSFVIVMTGAEHIIPLSSFVFGHVVQLFMYCASANELTYQSETLATSVFHSGWYEMRSTIDEKKLITVLQFSQIPKTLSALGIITLNYPTFVGVLRFSFSFYTFLTTIVKK